MIDDWSEKEINYCYYDADQFTQYFESKFGIFILYLNISYFNAYIDDFISHLSRLYLRSQVIFVGGTRFSSEVDSDISGYVAYYSFRSTREGGVSIFVSHELNSELLSELTMWTTADKVSAVKINLNSN